MVDRKTKILLAVGGVMALIVALPLFLWAVIFNGNFDIRNRAQEVPSPTPAESPTASPSASPSSSPSASPSASPTASPTTTPTACNPADINSDGVVDVLDYSFLISDFFKTNSTHPRSDINKDGIVDVVDYSLLVTSFFKSTGACQ